jgi:photosynthetic reaction center cytochrome c subunit
LSKNLSLSSAFCQARFVRGVGRFLYVVAPAGGENRATNCELVNYLDMKRHLAYGSAQRRLKSKRSGPHVEGNMKLGSRRVIVGALAAATACLLGGAFAYGQAGPEQRPLLAEEVFKNIQVLRGIPADEFMGTMGFKAASTGLNCTDCHTGDGSSWDTYADDSSPRKQTARKMFLMMNTINQTFFEGRRVLTCYSCHNGGDRPKVTPNLAAQYGAPLPDEPEDALEQATGAPSPDQVLNKYIQAVGGAQRVASLTSFVAKGTSAGFGPEEEKRPVEIFAKAGGQLTTIVHTLDGDSTRTYDGRAAWISAPHRPIPVLGLTGDDLAGAKLEADLAFPARIKQALSEWRVGFPFTIEDRDVVIVQGTTSAGRPPVKLFFDAESGLLVRMMRYTDSPVGRIPTQIDYADYRTVSGVKLPFRWVVTWTDGRETFELNEVQANAAIDSAKFAKPAPPRPPNR